MIETALRETLGAWISGLGELPNSAFRGRRSNPKSENWESTGTFLRPLDLYLRDPTFRFIKARVVLQSRYTPTVACRKSGKCQNTARIYRADAADS